jgi:hypothetical protein
MVSRGAAYPGRLPGAMKRIARHGHRRRCACSSHHDPAAFVWQTGRFVAMRRARSTAIEL